MTWDRSTRVREGRHRTTRDPERRWPVRRILTWTAVGLAILLVAGFVGAGWYFSSQIRADLLDPTIDPPKYEIRVLEAAPDRVVLEATDDSLQEGTYGVEWRGGYGQTGDILANRPGGVERELRVIEGSLTAGERVRVLSFAFPEDPERAHGIEFQ